MYQLIKEAWVDDDDIHVTLASKKGGGMTLVLNYKDINRARKELMITRPVKTIPQKIIFARKIVGEVINISSLGGNKTRKEAIKDARKMASKKTISVEIKFWGYDRTEVKPVDLLDKFITVKKTVQDTKEIGKNFTGFSSIKTVKPGEENEDEITVICSFIKDYHSKGKLESNLTTFVKILLTVKEIGNLEFGTFEIKD